MMNRDSLIKADEKRLNFRNFLTIKKIFPPIEDTGFMHNRVRTITAGFLCKHLLIDWRWGEAYFA